MFHHHINEINVNKNKIYLPAGWIKFLIWKTDSEFKEITLVKREDHTKYVLSQGEFQYFERIKVGETQLSDGWGSMYFCLSPYDQSMDSGALYAKPCQYYLEFPSSGTLWVISTKILVLNGDHIIEKYVN
jgi:hypothetical protein